MNDEFKQENDDIGFASTFHETQRMDSWWVVLLIGGISAWTWWGFYQQIVLGKPFGDQPASDPMMWLITVLVGLVFPIGFAMMKLVVEVRFDRLYIRFFPFTTREIMFTEIDSFQARQYAPVREYGGWGIRGARSLGSKMAYNTKGNWGVDVELENGRFVMIGSQRTNELEAALATAINSYKKRYESMEKTTH